MTNTPLPSVHITAAALHLISTEARRSYDGLETGGILLGYDNSDRIDILHAGEPGPHAQRGPRTFNRDLVYAQNLAQIAWSEDQSQWIGEWHTHPSTDPTPSEVDLHSYLSHIQDPSLSLARFLAIIISINPTGEMTAVTWYIDSRGCHPIRLNTADTHPQLGKTTQPPIGEK